MTFAFCNFHFAMESFSIVSRSAAQTRNWGKKLGKLLQGGEIIGLTGELGSGKTCFVRGLAEGLEVDKNAWVRSPTFTLINEYDGRAPLFHIDLYRIVGGKELEELNLAEHFFSDGVSVVEWFDRLPEGEVETYLAIGFAHAGGNQRKLSFTAYGERYERLLKELRG
ncbi:MAG: tRNA (adenosine(37)-N6)-threonylcarbamoyltransferase complex ATPase subunit type 1 TsaE [Candidatus Binatia bacterium]